MGDIFTATAVGIYTLLNIMILLYLVFEVHDIADFRHNLKVKHLFFLLMGFPAIMIVLAIYSFLTLVEKVESLFIRLSMTKFMEKEIKFKKKEK